MDSATKQVQDVKILQKVNAAHREAFREKFPSQLEHMLRLSAERLQAVLTKYADTDIRDPATWACSPTEIRDLAIAVESLYSIYKEVKNV